MSPADPPIKQAHRARSPATREIVLTDSFAMYRGGVLEQTTIAFETWGTLNSDRSNAILLFTGLSPSAHAASSKADPQPGWWEFMIGHGLPIDTSRYFLICINSLGSCYGSTGPTATNPTTNEPYRCGFPALAVEDIATAGTALLDRLSIDTLYAVAGASLGGMSSLAFAVLFPDRYRRLISMCAATKASPFAIAIRSLQREVIRNDPDWLGGNYPPYHEPVEGMRLARKLGLISYRSASEWSLRFARDRVEEGADHGPFAIEFQIESYLEGNAKRFVGTFDANSYLYLSRAMDWFDLGDHKEKLIGLSQQSDNKRALIVGVETDLLFPLEQQREMAELLHDIGMRVSFEALPSLQGHDAFLVDKARFAPVVERFLAQE